MNSCKISTKKVRVNKRLQNNIDFLTFFLKVVVIFFKNAMKNADFETIKFMDGPKPLHFFFAIKITTPFQKFDYVNSIDEQVSKARPYPFIQILCISVLF